MKKFKYRVQSYLKYLEFEREGALKELKRAENYRNNLMEKYKFMETQKKEAYQICSEVGQQGRSLNFINDNNNFIQMLKIHMENLSIEIQQAQQEYQVKYHNLMELQLKLKKMELHKEAEFQKYKKEIRKKQQKMTDEINSTRKRGQNAKSV